MPSTVIRVRLVSRRGSRPLTGGAELLDNQANEPGHITWVDIEGALEPDGARELQTRFGLHTLALQDAARDRHPPKFEVFETYSFLLLKSLSADSESIDCSTLQMAIFVGEDFLVTRHSGPSPEIERLAAELEQDPGQAAAGSGRLAIRLSRLIVERYLKLLLSLEPRLEELEHAVLNRGNDAVLGELTGYKSDLTRLRRFFHYHVDLVNTMRTPGNPGFGPELAHEINDLYEHQERVTSLADMYYNQASDLIEGYLSISAHRLNRIMQVLTIITAIFVPLSFLAGIYGMNFENMPELKSPFGYYTLLGTMGILAVSMLYAFKRKRWL